MIGEIWNYLMRRKLLLGLLAVFLAFGGVMGAKIMAIHETVVSHAQEIGTGIAPTYDNSLTFRVPSQSGKIAYELMLASDFRSAKVTVSDANVDYTVSIRILNSVGQVVAHEQATSTNSGIKFSDTTKTYSLLLAKGYVIEVQGSGVQVVSNLTHGSAKAFYPSGTTERYIVMTNGIRKASWSEVEGETALYNIRKDYIVSQIENYKAKTPNEVLNNKNLDTATKTQLVYAYRNLNSADQAIYREFIFNLQRGGVPEITYSGAREYVVGSRVDFAKLVSVYDGEDGVYAPEQITAQSDVNFDQVGKYTVAYTASDSDGNTVTLKIPIAIIEAKNEVTTEPNQATSVVVSSSVDNTTLSTIPNVGGGGNLETGSIGVENTESEPEAANFDDNSDVTTEITSSANQPKGAELSEDIPSGVNASQVILVVLGIVLLVGLVRFIFDHYVR